MPASCPTKIYTFSLPVTRLAVAELVPAFDDAGELGVEVVEEARHVAQAGAGVRVEPSGGLDALVGHVGKLAVGRLLGPAGRVPRVVGQAVQVAAGAWHGLPFGQAHMHQIPHRVGDGSRADLQSGR